LAIAGYAIGGGTATAAQPLREVPKQIVLTASDIAMYDDLEDLLWEDLFHKGLLESLRRWV